MISTPTCECAGRVSGEHPSSCHTLCWMRSNMLHKTQATRCCFQIPHTPLQSASVTHQCTSQGVTMVLCLTCAIAVLSLGDANTLCQLENGVELPDHHVQGSGMRMTSQGIAPICKVALAVGCVYSHLYSARGSELTDEVQCRNLGHGRQEMHLEVETLLN